ncbi:isochorismatase domain-containing protein 1 [Fukomys damarensis]|uniref:isochorismatase domain-containing protein 1 n=1 Tax=Fukomys damarensis TaxID=885580 RepID=UPI00053FCFB6|nr:isochorismatase domain-containing protein 1 [Fukomys damarensis]
MQERFRPAIKYFGDIISVGQRLLQGARILGIPVIVTEQYPKGLGSTVQEIDLTGVKLVLPKSKFSMVLPEVEAALAEIPGVRSVVLFGVETHVCIQQTALELVGRGIEVHIVADATSSRSMMDRMFALEVYLKFHPSATEEKNLYFNRIPDFSLPARTFSFHHKLLFPDMDLHRTLQ